MAYLNTYTGVTYSGAMAMTEPKRELPSWTFFTNHAHVLIALSRDPELRQRDISYIVGITPAAVQRILDDLEQGEYIRREKIGRRNRYDVLPGAPLRHPLEAHHTINEVLSLLSD